MKNKFYITIVLLTIFFVKCGNPDKKNYSELGKSEKFIVTGTMDNGEGKKLYLQKISSSSNVIDDSAIVDSKLRFKLQSSTDYPNLFILRTEAGPFFVICVRGGEKIEVKADYNAFSNYSLTGSEESVKILELGQKTREVLNKISQLSQISQDSISSPNYTAIKSKINSDFEKIRSEFRSYSKDFIDKTSSSLVSLLALKNQLGPQMFIFNPSEDKKLFTHVDSVLMSAFPKSDLVVSLHNELTSYYSQVEATNPLSSALATGNVVPEISLPSPEGKIINLSSLKGKYVLLDFWASWCPPCRAENPNLVMNYQKYHSEGFEIFQVSLDRTKEDWLKGIRADNLNWFHVSDLKYWNSSVVPLYAIQSIPTNYLLDREGKIIASNLRGLALGEELKKIFNK
jgi:thiol-disulfide isomerase/thioredoxin